MPAWGNAAASPAAPRPQVSVAPAWPAAALPASSILRNAALRNNAAGATLANRSVLAATPSIDAERLARRCHRKRVAVIVAAQWRRFVLLRHAADAGACHHRRWLLQAGMEALCSAAAQGRLAWRRAAIWDARRGRLRQGACLREWAVAAHAAAAGRRRMQAAEAMHARRLAGRALCAWQQLRIQRARQAILRAEQHRQAVLLRAALAAWSGAAGCAREEAWMSAVALTAWARARYAAAFTAWLRYVHHKRLWRAHTSAAGVMACSGRLRPAAAAEVDSARRVLCAWRDAVFDAAMLRFQEARASVFWRERTSRAALVAWHACSQPDNSVAGPPPGRQQQCAIVEHSNYKGDWLETNISSVAECCAQCAARASCHVFTYCPSSGGCTNGKGAVVQSWAEGPDVSFVSGSVN
ncbi:hypothetical protein WJX81_004614 [Elliptochloris bilobata]|uniref:Apple domain-containing protein n=1 Tax=Elliptochloris bilobata TaxID=381761 RepID=A0AAW1S2L0_9CHLO